MRRGAPTRRELVAGLGGLAALPAAARAQPRERVRQIGLLLAFPENESEAQERLRVFRVALEGAGWIEGRNLRSEHRWAAADPKLARAYAAELVALKPSLIFAAPTSMATALQRETRSLPIVFAQVADPVGAGLVASFARPGGNVTGFSHFEFPFGSKWLELLKEIAPKVTRAAVLYDPANPASTGYLPIIDAAARALSMDVFPAAVRGESEIERAISDAAREPNSGLVLIPGPIMGTQRELIILLARRHKLPSVYGFRYHPAGGGLASYGVDLLDLYRRAAGYVDRILKGEKPSDLPVQAPTKFELVINRKAAQALGLEVSPMLLARADEIID